MSEHIGHRDPARRAQDLLDLGRHAEAYDVLGHLLAERPDEVGLHGLMAQAQLGLDDLPGALRAGNSVVSLAPDDEWGHRICAIVLDRMNHHDQATVAAANAVRLDPDNWLTHQVYAQAAVDTRDRVRDARSAAERAVQLAPNEPGAHFVLGVVAQRTHHYDNAREAYQRTLALEPSHAMALHNLTVLDGGVRLSKSARGFSAALQLAPGESAMLENVDWLAVRFVRRIYFAALAGLISGLAAALPNGGVDQGGRVTPWSVAIAAVVLLGSATYAWSLARSVPAGIRYYVRSRMLQDWYLRANLALTALMLIVAIVVCLVPGGAVVGIVALRPLGIANIALLIWTVNRR